MTSATAPQTRVVPAPARPAPAAPARPLAAGPSPAPYLAVALAGLALWVALLALRGGDWTVLNGDQSGYYAYLPSLVLDGDLDFSNQTMPYAGLRFVNKWPTGVAITCLPAFLPAHALCLALDAAGLAGSWAAPNGESDLYLLFVIGWLMLLGAAGAWLGARLLTERYGLSPRGATLAVLAWWLGSNMTWHYLREPLQAHAPGAAWMLAATYLAHRLLPRDPAERPRLAWASAAFAFACSMAVAARFTSALLVAPLAAAVVGGLIWRGRGRDVLRALPLAILACWPLLAQWLVLRAMHAGAAADAAAALVAVPTDQQSVGYGSNEVFYWTRPALLRTLFSSRHGLFFFSPILLFAAWGVVRGMRQRALWRDGVAVGLCVGFVLLWYVNSAWFAWWFGGGFGARAFVEAAPLYVIGLGLAVAAIARLRTARRRIVVGLALAAVAVNWVLMGLWAGKLVGREAYLIPWEKRTTVNGWDRI